jgi:hypothetical protein
MDESVAAEMYARGQVGALGDLDGDDARPPGEEPEIFTGEVPPEEELGGEESDSAAVAAPAVVAATSGVVDAPPTGSLVDSLAEAPGSAPATPPVSTRPIKIVLTLRPGRNPNEPGSALIAVGAEGREPAFRYLDSADLAVTLARVPEVVATTIEAWDRRQKSGSIGSRPAPVSVPSAVPATGSGTTGPSAAARTQPATQSRRAHSGESPVEQASLFG